MDIDSVLKMSPEEIVSLLAKAKGDMIHCEHYRSVIKSLEMKKAEMRGLGPSIAAQEREANASKEYREVIDQWEKAMHDSVLLEYALSVKGR